jgi:hypothetical protein
MPVDNPQCANYFYYCIIQMVFNVSTDLLMLLIPIPFVLNARVPPAKRAMLVGVFSLGIFVVLASVLNKYFNFTMKNTTIYMLWDIRETSTAIYVANIMCWWPLIKKIFGGSGSFLRSGSTSRRSKTSFGFETLPENQQVVMGIQPASPVSPKRRRRDEWGDEVFDHEDLEMSDSKKNWPLKQ